MNNNNIKIAIVDDERILRVSIADDLRDEGFVVREYAGASGILVDFKEFNPDIVITDIKMPQMDGIELLKRVKIGRASCRERV